MKKSILCLSFGFRLCTTLYVLSVLAVVMFFPFEINAQSRRALLVGISDYESFSEDTGWENIHGADDAKLVSEVLELHGFNDIVMLLDDEATHDRIVKELYDLAQRTDEGDTLLFLFSGHGQPFEDIDGDEGKDDGWDESIVPYDAPMIFKKGKYEGEYHITDDQLHHLMLGLRKATGEKGMVYALLDACYSGSGIRGDEEVENRADMPFSIMAFCINGHRPFNPMRIGSSYRQLEAIDGCASIIALQASMPHQRNREIKVGDKFYGPLCYYVTEVLKRQDISARHEWIKEVIKCYRADKRLYRQGIFCEYTMGALR